MVVELEDKMEMIYNDNIRTNNRRTYQPFQTRRTKLEKRLIHLSNSNNISNMFTTGLGWHQNLVALEEHRIIHPQAKKDIDNVMKLLCSFCRRHEISSNELEFVNDEWDRLMNNLTQCQNYSSSLN